MGAFDSISNITGENLMDIGNVLGLRKAIDQDFRVTKYIRSYLATVDIIPVDYVLKLNVLNQKSSGWAVEYDFSTPISVYKQLCGKYGLKPAAGCRLWLTDDTQSYEEFTQTFDNNIIEKAINSLAGKAADLNAILKSTASTDVLKDLTQKATDKFTTTAKDYGGSMAKEMTQLVGGDQALADKIRDAASSAIGTAAEIIFQGKQVSLPKIWKGSNYNPTLNLVVKLVSPYGHKTAIKNYIIRPLLYLLLLAAPRSNDGLSYGLYQPVRVKAYGLSNVNLGAIMNIGVRRGGKETAYNVWKQPLIVEVAMSIRPLSDGYAAMQDGFDVATFDDGDTDYKENATGSPIITTVGNMVQSLRPAPRDVVEANAPSGGFTSSTSSALGDILNNLTSLGTSVVPKIESFVKNLFS